MTENEIRERLSRGEDSHCEFREIVFYGDEPKEPRRAHLADEIAAFANAQGGLLCCGVTDAGDVQGMSPEQMSRLQRMIVDVCTDSITPPVWPTTGVHLLGGKGLVIVHVPRGDTLHESPGGHYLRVGESKKKISADEQLILIQKRGQARFLWFDKQPVPETGFRTMKEELWRPLLSVDGQRDPEVALEQLRLLAKDEAGALRASVAGILLCTDKPHRWVPRATFSVARYDGLDRSDSQIDAEEITGPLNHQIRDAMVFVRRNMSVAARKIPARVDMPEYSLRAVFEAVTNAVVHRDYSMSARRIRLAMFDDRIELSSPGALANGLTTDAMHKSQSTRNEALASVFQLMSAKDIPGAEDRLHIIEQRGDGVRIIMRETRELSGKTPAYEAPDGRELFLTIPAARHRHSPHAAVVRVLSGGAPLQGARLLVLYPNKTRVEETTGYDGEACIDLYTSELPMTVFVAAHGKRAHREERWLPSEGTLEIDLEALPDGGSVIFPDGAGNIPGLSGRVNPIRDKQDRTYLYANNIAINQGESLPVVFYLGEELRFTDSSGAEKLIRIVDIMGKSSLLEHRPLSEE